MDKNAKLELSHDLLARNIAKRLSLEERTSRIAERIVKDNLQRHRISLEEEGSHWLNQSDISFVKEFGNKINLDNDESEYLEKSEKVIEEKITELKRVKKSKQRADLSIAAFAIALLVALFFYFDLSSEKKVRDAEYIAASYLVEKLIPRLTSLFAFNIDQLYIDQAVSVNIDAWRVLDSLSVLQVDIQDRNFSEDLLESVKRNTSELIFFFRESEKFSEGVSLIDSISRYKRLFTMSDTLVLDTLIYLDSMYWKMIKNNKEVDSSIYNKYYPKLKKVNGGKFKMGNSPSKRFQKDEIAHEVIVSDFWIAENEITRLQYFLFMESTHKGEHYIGNTSWGNKGSLPIVFVDWLQAIEYTNWLSYKHGLDSIQRRGNSGKYTLKPNASGYRLPTEAEWEFASGGGLKGRENVSGFPPPYSGYDSIDTAGWYVGNTSERPETVGQKASNKLGLYDMSGNVWEWCWDWYGPYQTNGIQENPLGPKNGTKRIMRGGSWASTNPRMSQTSNRFSLDPTFISYNVGFRPVKTIPSSR